MADINRTTIDLPKVAPVVAGADPAVDIKAVAERVDSVLTSLKAQMKNFEAADASELSGVPASSVISGANSMYYQTFENPVENDWVFSDGSAAAISYPTNGRAGGKALRTTNVEVILEDNNFIPFDQSRLYRMRTRYRDVSGSNRGARVGVRCYDETYTLIGGFQAVCLYDNTNSTSTWTTATGYFRDDTASGDVVTPSTDASAPEAIWAGTRYIRPYLHLSAGGDDQTAELDYITLEILTETLESNELVTAVGGRSVSTVASTVGSDGVITEDNVDGDSIATGSVGGGGGSSKAHIIAGSIIADNIAANTITAAKIFANTITVNELASLTGGGLTINFAATGSNPVLSHSAFQLDADGDATFSGTVSASSFTASVASFSGRIVVGDSGGVTEFQDAVTFSEGGSVQVEDGRIFEFYDSGNTFRGDLRADYSPSVLPSGGSGIWARGNWEFNEGIYQNLSTEDLNFIDAGSASATEQDWIQVTVGGNTGYIRVYASK